MKNIENEEPYLLKSISEENENEGDVSFQHTGPQLKINCSPPINIGKNKIVNFEKEKIDLCENANKIMINENLGCNFYNF